MRFALFMRIVRCLLCSYFRGETVEGLIEITGGLLIVLLGDKVRMKNRSKVDASKEACRNRRVESLDLIRKFYNLFLFDLRCNLQVRCQ